MRRLEVLLDWDDEPTRVGTLAERDRRIYFEYAASFIDDPLPLSPFKLPVRPGLHEDVERTFGGLHGVFYDSLPDGWGLLLMDRRFRQAGIDLGRVTPLDRLAYIGGRSMGALIYQPAQSLDEASLLTVDLDHLAGQAKLVLEGSAEDILPQLVVAGGSPGGARPKVLVGVREADNHMVSGGTGLPEGYRHYMIKFGALEDGADIGAVEAAYAIMAGQAGIEMRRTRLFETGAGRYFGVERFDVNGERRHVHTLGGLLHASHRHPSIEYDAFLRATLMLTRDHRQVVAAFRQMAFNVFAHNRDDHARNFSFVMARDGTWTLTPAYDIVFSYGIQGWHTMAVEGEAENPTRSQMLRVGEANGIVRKDGQQIIERVEGAVAAWPRIARDLDVSDERIRSIETELRRIRGG